MNRPSDDRDELVEELRDRTQSLERRLTEGEESRKRDDRIIAQLTQANTALTERLRELEAAPATPGAPQSREVAYSRACTDLRRASMGAWERTVEHRRTAGATS